MNYTTKDFSQIHPPEDKPVNVVGADNTFLEIDDALYRHEQPFYRACAGGAHFTVTLEWKRERQRLNNLRHAKYPYKTKIEQKKTWLEKLRTWFGLREKQNG